MGRRRCKLPIKNNGIFLYPVCCWRYECSIRYYTKLHTVLLIIILGTCLVALSSGYIAETLVKRDDGGKGTDKL